MEEYRLNWVKCSEICFRILVNFLEYLEKCLMLLFSKSISKLSCMKMQLAWSIWRLVSLSVTSGCSISGNPQWWDSVRECHVLGTGNEGKNGLGLALNRHQKSFMQPCANSPWDLRTMPQNETRLCEFPVCSMHDLAFFKVPKGTPFSLSFSQFKATAQT